MIYRSKRTIYAWKYSRWKVRQPINDLVQYSFRDSLWLWIWWGKREDEEIRFVAKQLQGRRNSLHIGYMAVKSTLIYGAICSSIRSFACTTHSLALLCWRALLRSFVHSLTYSQGGRSKKGFSSWHELVDFIQFQPIVTCFKGQLPPTPPST